jgi:hypothetical protein
MGTQNYVKAVLSILVIGTFCAGVVALGTQAVSKGYARQALAKIDKAKAPVSRARAVKSEDASPADASGNRWPSLADF